MGSICHCFKKEHWKIRKEGTLKSNNKPAYELEVGEWDDYGGGGYLGVTMLKEVYDKIMSGEYTVINQAYSEVPIVVKDKTGNIVNLLESEQDGKEMKEDWVITISSGYYTKDFEEHCRFNDNFSDAIIFRDKTKDEVQEFAENKLRGIKTCWRVVSYKEALNQYNGRTFVVVDNKKYKLGRHISIHEAIDIVKSGKEVCCEYQTTKTLWTKDTMPEKVNVDIISKGLFRMVSLT